MIYIYIDGDDIGLAIEKNFMENNEVSLKQINQDINSIAEQISSYFIDLGFSILFLGADGIICKGESVDIRDLLVYIKKISDKFTFSIGVGNDLRNAFLALRYAKSIGKDASVLLMDKDFEVIRN